MFQNIPVIPIIAAIAVFIGYMVAMQFFDRKETVRRRLGKMVNAAGNLENEDGFIDSLRSEKDPSAFAATISGIFSYIGIDTEAVRAKNQLRFYQAGIHSPDAHVHYLLFTRLFSFGFLAWAVYVAAQDTAGLTEYAEALCLACIGLFGADLWIKNKQDKRKKILQNSFPDALDLLLACVESGLALDGALSRVCKELGQAHPEITLELNRTRMELSLLNDRTQALNNLAERNGLLAIRLFVTALLQSEKFGTSLTDTLRVMSEDYRHQRLMRAEEKAGRLPALMTIPLIVFLLPALFLIILGPAMLSVAETFKQ